MRRVHRERMGLMVICGYRNQFDQTAAFSSGKSRLKWPKSKHNTLPAQAVDVAPLPLDWNDLKAFRELARHVQEIAAEEGVKLRWGGNFVSWKDFPHWELAK